MSELPSRLRGFASSLLQYRGALVEWPEHSPSGMAILPGDVAAEFADQEALTLTLQPGNSAAGELGVSLTSSFVDMAESWLSASSRIAHVRMDQAYLKKSGIEDLVARQFQWANARVRIAGTSAGICEYHHWHARVQLTSEERWEDLFHVTLNASSGASAVVGDPLADADWKPCAGGAVDHSRTLAGAMRRSVAAAKRKSMAFVQRLDQRLERDRHRIEQYYNALLREKPGARLRAADDEERQADRRRAVNLEKKRKLLELDERYTMRVAAEPIALVVAKMPVLTIQMEVTRKRATATHSLYWNPVARNLEPLACGHCGSDINTVAFTDDTVLPRCVACASA